MNIKPTNIPSDSTNGNEVIAIIGAGYSGALTAINILQNSTNRNVKILLFERSPPFGRGLAYRTWDDNLLLNVPAGNISAFAEDHDHFVRYCQEIDPAFNAGSFISRRIYGDYLEASLLQAERAAVDKLHRIAGDVIAIHKEAGENKFSIRLDGSETYSATRVILALGHSAPKDPTPSLESSLKAVYIGNPWNFPEMDKTDPEQPVALLGTGHTAIDALFRLTSCNHTRRIFLISRRGLLPQQHRSTPKAPLATTFPLYLENRPATARAYMRALREEINRRKNKGEDWRDVINELRPHIPAIWHSWQTAERLRFQRHVLPFWDIHRHRLAPSTHLRLKKLIESGQVKIIAGRVRTVTQDGRNATLAIQQRNIPMTLEINVGAIINCTGPNNDIATSNSRLIEQLLTDGLIKQDVMKIGLETNENYQLINGAGEVIPDLFYIGPMLKTKYWEAIAIPELRKHSLLLAKIITSEK